MTWVAHTHLRFGTYERHLAEAHPADGPRGAEAMRSCWGPLWIWLAGLPSA